MKEVNYEEYIALKKRVEELEKRQTQDIPLSSGWSYAVTELPISGTELYDKRSLEKPTVYYTKGARDAWQAFTKLAKQIHEKNSYHLVPAGSWRRENYIWDRKTLYAPKSHTALTYEEKLLSLEMLNELVPIYNKYYKLAHPYAEFYEAGVKAFNLQIIDEDECRSETE